MKEKLSKLIVILLMFIMGCISTNISKGDFPKDGKAVVFMGVKMSGDVYTYGVFIAQENRHVRESDGLFNFYSNKPIEAIFLLPGKYYYTVANYANVIIFLHNPKRIFKIDDNYINYIGTIVFDSDQANMIFNAKIDDTQGTYKEAIQNFKMRFPELSKKYKFKYSLLN